MKVVLPEYGVGQVTIGEVLRHIKGEQITDLEFECKIRRYDFQTFKYGLLSPARKHMGRDTGETDVSEIIQLCNKYQIPYKKKDVLLKEEVYRNNKLHRYEYETILCFSIPRNIVGRINKDIKAQEERDKQIKIQSDYGRLNSNSYGRAKVEELKKTSFVLEFTSFLSMWTSGALDYRNDNLERKLRDCYNQAMKQAKLGICVKSYCVEIRGNITGSSYIRFVDHDYQQIEDYKMRKTLELALLEYLTERIKACDVCVDCEYIGDEEGFSTLLISFKYNNDLKQW